MKFNVSSESKGDVVKFKADERDNEELSYQKNKLEITINKKTKKAKFDLSSSHTTWGTTKSISGDCEIDLPN